MIMDKDSVTKLAKKHGWDIVADQVNPPVLILRQGSNKMNVYYTTGTIATTVTHPVKGRGQLFRRDIDMATLGRLMRNPRQHTGKGYTTLDRLPGEQPLFGGNWNQAKGL